MSNISNNKPIKIDWSQVDRPFPVVNDSSLRDTCLRMANRFEQAIFEFMTENRCTEIYVVEECGHYGEITHCYWTISKNKPLFHDGYRAYNFDRLLDVGDEEFESMPETKNKKYVREWRKIMKEKANDGT